MIGSVFWSQGSYCTPCQGEAPNSLPCEGEGWGGVAHVLLISNITVNSLVFLM